MTHKRMFLWYCAFAPFIAMAMACQTADLVTTNDEEMNHFLFAVMLMTAPMSLWLAVSAIRPAYGISVIDIYCVALGLSFFPQTMQPIAVMLLMIGSGLLLLLISDAVKLAAIIKKNKEANATNDQQDHQGGNKVLN